MKCKYIITLENGVKLELDSLSDGFEGNDSIEEFKKSLELILETDETGLILKNALSEIESSQKVVLNIDGFDISNAIGTTSVNHLVGSVNKSPGRELQNNIVDGVRGIHEWLKTATMNFGYPSINSNNIIAAMFDSDEPSAFLTKYFPDRKFLLIDVDNVRSGKYEKIFKGLIDYSLNMLGNDETFTTTILDVFGKDLNFDTYESFLSQMDTLPNNYDKKYNLLLNAIELKLGLNSGILSQLYFMHGNVNNGEPVKFQQSLKTQKGNSLIKQAEAVQEKYAPLTKEGERDSYYSENNYSDAKSFPFIQTGDLIKYYDGTHINGIFYIYVGTNEGKELKLDGKSKRFGNTHIIVSNNGITREVTDADLIKDDRFTYKKNISTDLKELVTDKLYINKGNNDYFHLNYEDVVVSPEIIRNLENGDKVFIKKKGIRAPLEHYVLGVIGNSIVVSDLKNNKTSYSIDNLPPITSLKLLKETHIEINNEENSKIDNYYDVTAGFINNHVTEANIDSLLKSMKVGDIVRTASKNGENKYHNLVVGFNEDKSQISILNNKQKIIQVNKSQLLNIIYNFKNVKNEIKFAVNNKEKAMSLLNSFKNDRYSTYSGNAEYDDYFSVMDVSIPSVYSNNLKAKIQVGDFVANNKIMYSVLGITPTELIVFDNQRGVKTLRFQEVTHIVKNNFKLGFENKTLQLNSWLVGSELDKNFMNVFKSGKFELVELKYIKPNTSDTTTKFLTNGKIAGAYWITMEEFKKVKKDVLDLTDVISKSEYGDVRKMYGINAFSNNGKEYRLKNLSGYNKISNIKSMEIDEFMNLVTKGMMVRLNTPGDFKTYRIEEVQNAGQQHGLFLSYTMTDNNGKNSSFIKFVSKESITESGKVNMIALYSPNNFKVNKRLQDAANFSSDKKNLIGKSDKVEAFSKIGEYLEESFGIKMNMVSSEEVPEEILGKKASEVKAFILNGEIYINYTTASLSDPIHELMHMFLGTMKVLNTTEYLTLLNSSKKHYQFKELMENYKGNTKLDIYEEIFVDLFTKFVKEDLNDYKLFDIAKLDNVIKDTIKKMFDLGKDLDNISGIELLGKSVMDVVNDSESNLFLDPISYMNMDLSNQSIKISSLKRQMLEDNTLEEKCYE